VSKYTVSSTFNKNHKEFGKKYLIDGRDDTCWNSDQGLPQHVSVTFQRPQKLVGFTIVAQGGFSPREIVVVVDSHEVERFEAQDINELQSFKLASC
jgi:hypothetical protein